MRKLTLVVSMLFSAVSIAGAQGTTPGDTTTVADVRSKAETVSSVAVITAPNTTPAPVRTGFGKRIVDRSKSKTVTPAVKSKTTTTVTTKSAPVSTTVKTETEFGPISDDSIRKANKPAPPADFSGMKMGSGSTAPAAKPTAVTPPEESAKPAVVASNDATKAVSKPHIGLPFARKTDQLGLVNAIRTCDRKVLYVRCDDLVDEFNRVIGQKMGRHFSNRDEIATFLADAHEASCPVGEMANLSRVLGTRVRAKDYWPRKFRPGERCLYVDNLLILSLDCSNPAKSTHYLRAPKQEAAETPRSEKKVVFMPPAEPLGTVTTPEYKKGFPTKRVVGGVAALLIIDQALCQWVDDRFCLVKINMHQSQKQSL